MGPAILAVRRIRRRISGRVARPESRRETIRNRIHAAVAQRLAAQQARTRHQAAANGAVTFDRSHRVIRTTGMKTTALTEQWTQEALVALQQLDQDSMKHANMLAGAPRL